MKRFLSILLCGATTLAAAGYAVAAPEYLSERAEAVKMMSRGFSKSGADDDARQANMASQRGDWAVSRAFAERSYQEKPSIRNEFNLATAYERTGRGDLAVPLYIDLVDRGQYTQMLPFDNFYQLPQSPMLTNMSDEAASRLARMGNGTAVAGAVKAYPVLVLK